MVWPTNNARNAEAALKHGSFRAGEGGLAAIGPSEVFGAIVGGEDDDGIVIEALVFQLLHDRADDVVAFFPPQPNNGSNYDTFVRILTLYMFTCPSRQVR